MRLPLVYSLSVYSKMGIQLSCEYDTARMRVGPTILIGIALFVATSYFLTFKNEPEKWPIGLLFAIPILAALRFVKRKNLKNYRNLVMEEDHLLIQEQSANRNIPYSMIYSVACRPKSFYDVATILLISGEELRFSVNKTGKEHFAFREPAVITELKKKIGPYQWQDSYGTRSDGSNEVS